MRKRFIFLTLIGLVAMGNPGFCMESPDGEECVRSFAPARVNEEGKKELEKASEAINRALCDTCFKDKKYIGLNLDTFYEELEKKAEISDDKTQVRFSGCTLLKSLLQDTVEEKGEEVVRKQLEEKVFTTLKEAPPTEEDIDRGARAGSFFVSSHVDHDIDANPSQLFPSVGSIAFDAWQTGVRASNPIGWASFIGEGFGWW